MVPSPPAEGEDPAPPFNRKEWYRMENSKFRYCCGGTLWMNVDTVAIYNSILCYNQSGNSKIIAAVLRFCIYENPRRHHHHDKARSLHTNKTIQRRKTTVIIIDIRLCDLALAFLLR